VLSAECRVRQVKKILIAVVLLVVALLAGGTLMFYLRPIAVISALRRHDLAKAGFQKSTLDSSVGPQTVFTSGAGPTLIFLHGAGDNAGTWKDVAPQFTSRYRVVLVDLAGHGESAPLSGALKMETMLVGVDAVVAKQPGPVTLVGNSLGAWLAMLYATEHPERIARVVAVDGGPIAGERIDLARLPENREEARKTWDAVLDPGSPRIPNFMLDDVVRESHQGAIGRMERLDLEQHLVRDDQLRKFPVPIDLLWGESDRLVPLDYAQRLAKVLPASRLTRIARCGHIPQGECPKAFAAALEKILQQEVPAPALPMKDAALKERLP
jgi:pimeloyl-ACP methyl ester carboxylesterase